VLMKNQNELDLAGDDGEEITVEVVAEKNNPVLNYVLNGKPWTGKKFKLDRNVKPVFKLLVQAIYKTDTGGSCEIRVTGSNGGDVSEHTEFQSPGESFDAAVYTFTIL
jgi:hypothetical protein